MAEVVLSVLVCLDVRPFEFGYIDQVTHGMHMSRRVRPVRSLIEGKLPRCGGVNEPAPPRVPPLVGLNI